MSTKTNGGKSPNPEVSERATRRRFSAEYKLGILEEADRALVATDLVEALRESGVRDVMIYDDDGLLRIQALGERSPRLLPGLEPEP